LAVDSVRTLFRFEGVVRWAIHELKYKNLRAAAEPPFELLSSNYKENHMPAEVPVQCHQKRLGEPSYHQSELLAKALGKQSSLPVVNGYFIHQRHNTPQDQITSVGDRQQNVATALGCSDRQMQHNHNNVLLIDDLPTLGVYPQCLRRCPESIWSQISVRANPNQRSLKKRSLS
jgi:predicted amidophosphoribosyltransferase